MTSVPFPTAEEVAKLRRLHGEATPGPWSWETRHGHNGPFVPQGSFLGETLITLGDTYERSTEDCFLLSSMHCHLPSLLAAAEFTLKAEAFLREHAVTLKHALPEIETAGPAYLALNDLLRSLPARDEAGREL